ncbi:hypothetical protein PMZ80_005083 [Knufia obscura]|uniref:Oxysterol-binding protein n=2 Tax=Knufia TaxID=430999 RepID=A0AAN8FFV2_9EURO|nr:hypothetical protein PMZ80_005083 [Knufia obscura]KAK5957746.1 hypothetical protein OHC33_000935 [Knufia fluminis]
MAAPSSGVPSTTATPQGSNPSSRPTTPNLSTPPTTAATEIKGTDDSSRLKLFISILKKFIGVADIANVRFSLPAQLIEPIPNLEYWHYIDRPETFVSIGKSDDELGRMLEVLRFWFTKDLKFVKGKPCKPYNSALGEFFRCNWEIKEDAPSISSPMKAPPQPPPDPLKSDKGEPVRISYVTEQTSHHPPVSAYWVECPSRGIVARGYDQISAKFSGTYVKVAAGNHNKGLFISLKNRGNEEYHMTHPDSQLNGILRGNLYISVADVAQITCPKTKLKVLLDYVGESYFGKAQNKVIGVIYHYDPANDKYTKPKDVPDNDILVKIEGDWKDKVYYTIPSSKAVKAYPGLEPTKDKQLIIDIAPLMPVPKIVPPPEEQLDNESRKLWNEVSNAIHERKYGDATNIKQDVEQRQRDRAAEREKERKVFKPRFFKNATDPLGRPELTEEGRKVVEDMQRLEFHLEPRVDDSVPA